MQSQLATAALVLLAPLSIAVCYYDVRYRRIPNRLVLAALASGLAVNAIFGGFGGVLHSLAGCALAFGLMLVLHVFGAMGAGDVKLFAAVGALLGVGMVLPTFVAVALVGGALAVYTMLRAGAVRETMFRVVRIFVGLMPGWEMPRFAAPADRRHTIPYGVAISLGSIASVLIFRAS